MSSIAPAAGPRPAFPAASRLLCAAALTGTGLLFAAPPPFGIGSWPEPGHGNHRAVVRVETPGTVARIRIEWRRRDRDPETKAILVFAEGGAAVRNVWLRRVDRIAGELAFEPVSGPGTYFVYYLPYTPGTGNFDDAGTYFAPEETASPEWLRAHGLPPETEAAWAALPAARVPEIQARGEFHRFDPMEVIATPAETAALLGTRPTAPYLLFPEDRDHAVRMPDDIPLRWAERGPAERIALSARPGECLAFQVAVWAARAAIPGLDWERSDLAGDGGRTIPAAAVSCINLEGTDWIGRPVRPTFAIPEGRIRSLWFLVEVPADASGAYAGSIRLQPEGLPESAVAVQIDVAGEPLPDGGVRNPASLARLKWLNSTLGVDAEVIPPMIPLEVSPDALRLLDREIRFAPTGLPADLVSRSHSLLAAPIRLDVVPEAGPPVAWVQSASRTTRQTPGVVERETDLQHPSVSARVLLRAEADGCLSYRVRLRNGDRPLALRDVRLEVPLRADEVPYLMGMGRRGGTRPASLDWAWDVRRADNMVWLGGVPAGVQLKLEGPNDTWEMTDLRKSGLPDSWHNEGQGGCRVRETDGIVSLTAYSGPRTIPANTELEFRFRLLVTPFKRLDPEHWNRRYGNLRGGSTVLHVHHGVPENSHINYPFVDVDGLKALVDLAREAEWRETDPGNLTYPADTLIDPAGGTLDIWVRIAFDPAEGRAGHALYNRELLSLTWPNGDQLGFYRNVDDRGMRAYVRRGPPARNDYPAVLPTSQPDWQEGETHLLTLRWGRELAILVDGQPAGIITRPVPIGGDPAEAVLELRGTGFAIRALRLRRQSPDEPYTPAPEPEDTPGTVLLDVYGDGAAGQTTVPRQAPPGVVGTLAGTTTLTEHTDENRYLAFSARREYAGPKGVNLYYTVRELSNFVAEMWPLRSLGEEVFRTDGHFLYAVDKAEMVPPGGGYPWLREHLVSGYVPAWRQPLPNGETDAAIGTQGLSRWHNYYVEGLAWLMREIGIDGLYLDGIGYDREVMKRVAKTMVRTNPRSRINFHSGDNFRFMDNRLSSANQYMEHFPYLSDLWFGELYDYDMPPDYWLVEISGIPFGLTGEMLNYENGGNAYRGMIYGMSSRQNPSAPAVWALWDRFEIAKAEMLGYWDPACPVRTDRPDVLATVYRKPGAALVALARWPVGTRSRSAAAAPYAPEDIVDGYPDAEATQGAVRLADFTCFGREEAPGAPTEVRVGYDARRLYIRFRCEYPEGTRPRAEVAERDGPVWEDDAIEIFIQPDRQEPTYYQFVGNSRGAFSDNRSLDMAWNGEWAYRASAGPTAWEGDLSVPLSSLGIPAGTPGAAIGFNVCRDTREPAAEQSCWSPMSVTFHDPKQFATLVLGERADPGTHAADFAAVPVRLLADREGLGLGDGPLRVRAPALENFQDEAEFALDRPIPVLPGKGWLLEITPATP